MNTSVAAPDPDDGARRITDGTISTVSMTPSGLIAPNLASGTVTAQSVRTGAVTTLSITTTGA